MWQQLTAFSALPTSDEDEELADSHSAAPQGLESDDDSLQLLGRQGDTVANENDDAMMLLAGSRGRQRDVPLAASRKQPFSWMGEGRCLTMAITGAALLACCVVGALVTARSRAAVTTGERVKAAAGSEDGVLEAFHPTNDDEGWYDGGEDQNCDTGCAAVGLICTEEALEAHNSDVDTTSEVRALITAVGGSTSDSSCSSQHGLNPDVPHWKSAVCLRSRSVRSISTFDCSALPAPQGQGKHRLCYCHHTIIASPEGTTVTSSTTLTGTVTSTATATSGTTTTSTATATSSTKTSITRTSGTHTMTSITLTGVNTSAPTLVCDLNCYQDHGATDVDLGEQASGSLSDEDCRALCLDSANCDAVIRRKDDGTICAGKKDIHTSKCLPGTDWELELLRGQPWGKCAILGDPHIYTFDRPYQPDFGKYDQGHFWIQKCGEELMIEGRFGFTSMYPGESSAQGIAITGKVIDNNVLLVSYTGHGEWQDGFKAWWNNQEILTEYPSSFQSAEEYDDSNPILEASKGPMNPDNFHSKARHTIGTEGVALPSYLLKFPGASLQVYILLGQDAMNIIIEMKRLPVECDGYCGNFNCIPSDDTMSALKHRAMAGPLSSAANLFNEPGAHLPALEYEKGAKEVTCDESKRQDAETQCAALDEELRAGCIFDCCMSSTGCDGIAALEEAEEV